MTCTEKTGDGCTTKLDGEQLTLIRPMKHATNDQQVLPLAFKRKQSETIIIE